MVAILDQYEIEYKETYTSGTYDQVVMGKMFSVENFRGIKRYVAGLRGVVYGSINADQAPTPGTGLFDFTDSVSYQLQPYREKAGNCRAAKLMCYQERIYDTLMPDPLACFKINGASLFSIAADSDETPGMGPSRGVDSWTNAFIIFDNYIPEGNSSNLRNLNVGVDRHWTKSFPYEPKYNNVRRQKNISFKDVEVSYEAKFKASTMTLFRIKKKMSKLIFGTVGPAAIIKSDPTFGEDVTKQWFHHWAVDRSAITSATGSLFESDTIKVLFGYGDSNTSFLSGTIDSNNPTGYALRGTSNWPTFRSKNVTTFNPIGLPYPTGSYENATGSYWHISPIIRGWKYGIYNGLADYTSAYFRQGKYGQFRDMLEQRKFFVAINDSTSAPTRFDGPVDVKFVDADQNLTDPANTQSQNLSQYATSSLPYFDLEERNRPALRPLTNLSLVNFRIDGFNNVTI